LYSNLTEPSFTNKEWIDAMNSEIGMGPRGPWRLEGQQQQQEQEVIA